MPDTLSSEDYVSLGRQYYKNAKYDKALLNFTRAIDNGDDDVGTLDNRAATLEKLDRLQDALKDGRRMIRSDKKDVRGYLRAGRILQKMKDERSEQTALEIYRLGLKNVRKTDKHLKTLTAMCNKLTTITARNFDPLVWLPIEMVEMILEYLEFHHMVRCTRVSRSWWNFLTDRPNGWRHLDLSNAKRDVPAKSITRYLDCAKGRIEHATFHRHFKPESLLALMKTNRDLKSLKLLHTGYGTATLVSTFQAVSKRFNQPNCNWLQSLILSTHSPVTLDGFVQIMRYCTGLSQAHFCAIHPGRGDNGYSPTWTGPWPNLVDLRIRSINPGYDHRRGTMVYDWNLRDLFAAAPKLKMFDIEDTGANRVLDIMALPELTHLGLTGPVAVHCVLPESLESIKVDIYMGPPFAILGLNKLSNIDIAGSHTDLVLSDLDTRVRHGETSDRLSRVVFEFKPSFGDYDLKILLQIFRYGPNIKELGLKKTFMSDDIATQIPSLAPKLERVSLAESYITGVSVKALVLGLPNLKFLDITNCDRIGYDAVEWARSRGIKVVFPQQHNKQNKARKVRYE